VVTFDEPMRAVAPGQNLALYLPASAADCQGLGAQDCGGLGGGGFLCLGGGAIAAAGRSYWEMGKELPDDAPSWVV
jgi:hypothetical protein